MSCLRISYWWYGKHPLHMLELDLANPKEEVYSKKYFIYVFGCTWILSYGLWDLVPLTRIAPRLLTLGAQRLEPLDHQGSPKEEVLLDCLKTHHGFSEFEYE